MLQVRPHLDSGKVGPEATGQEGVSAKGRDAHKAAQVDQLNALQVVQSQLIIEELGKAGDLVVVHRLPSSDLHSDESCT